MGAGILSCSSARFDAGIACWGDSLTKGTGATTNAGTYRQQLATLTGKYVYNGGVGGETSTEIRTRLVAATEKYLRSTIIWAGRNNPTDPATVLADVAAMVAALGHQRYLVLSVTSMENGATEYSGGATYTDIATINAGLLAAYGSRYIDVRSYLISLYDPLDAQDVIDFGHDIIPSSLRSDAVHLNDDGYEAVANKVYESISILFP